MSKTVKELSIVLGKTEDEIVSYITSALNDPSEKLLEAFLDRFLYLKLLHEDQINQHKQELAKLYEQGKAHHMTRQINKLGL